MHVRFILSISNKDEIYFYINLKCHVHLIERFRFAESLLTLIIMLELNVTG
jgi:hypothetical protein